MADTALADRDRGITDALRRQRPPNSIPTPAEPIVTRRFQTPDLNEHGGWLVDRLSKLYPNVSTQMLWSRLNNVLYNNEFLFLYQKDAVAIAQMVRGSSIEPTPTVHEWFVMVREPSDAEAVDRAAVLYADFVRWAKAMGAAAVVLADISDVPVEKIKPQVGGRVLTREQTFVNTKG